MSDHAIPRAKSNGTVLRTIAGLCLVAGGGWLLQPICHRVRQEESANRLLHTQAVTDRGDALSRQLAFFTLGGLRSLAAEILTMDATSAWIERDWQRLQRRWETITMLCPNRVNYSMYAAGDMAKNAASDVSNRSDLPVHERAVITQHYIDRGIRFLTDALADHPDNALLHAQLGDLYSDIYRRPRFGKAVDAYRRAVECGAPEIYRRQIFYNLSRIRGREQEALALGRQLYADPRNRMPSVRCLLFVLQNRLNIPETERMSVNELFGSEENARRDLRSFQKNTLLFPVDGIREYLNRP